MRTLKAISLLAMMAALVLFGLTGCDTVTSPDAGDGTPTTATVAAPSKMRHAHLFGESHGTGKLVQRYEDLMTQTDFIVRIDDTVLDLNRLVGRYDDEEGVTIKRTYRKVYKGFAMHVDEDFVPTLLDLLDGDDEIVWVEPDPKVRNSPGQKFKLRGPPQQYLPWGIDRVGGPQSSAASGNGQGRVAVDLYIMDTGVKDKDIDVVEEMSFVGGQPKDNIGHGTHVAGTAAAEDDGDGVVGVAPGARVHNLKVLHANGQTEISTVIAAVEHVTELKLDDPSRPMVVNMSFGADVGTADYNALDDAVAASIAQGVVYVIAAGNEGINAETVTPAHVAEAITVGAYDQDDLFCDFSNYGSVVDLLAPGDDIESIRNHPSPRFLNRMSGTSMAAPHVAGAAALYLSHHPSATPAEVRAALVGAGRTWVSGTPPETTNKSLWVGDF